METREVMRKVYVCSCGQEYVNDWQANNCETNHTNERKQSLCTHAVFAYSTRNIDGEWDDSGIHITKICSHCHKEMGKVVVSEFMKDEQNEAIYKALKGD